VDAFADMVEETGAAWVIFTTTHGPQYFPARIEAIERILPGHTTKRDLISEIADALHRRNIRLMLYYHTSVGEMPAYQKTDKSMWFDDLCTIHQEINERYGARVAGWFIDDAHKWIYPTDFPWERLTRALKAGNPQRLIAFNPGTRPSVTLFGDLLASDNHAHLRHAASPDLFAPDGQYANLLQHYSFTLEPGKWALVNQPADGEWPKPAHSAQPLADYVQVCAEANVPLTMNMLISQDVTRDRPFVNPETLELMRYVRSVVRS
jgi:hypothetical protein